ncbi:unnamed protein product [Lampetra fluviatilis]
MGFANRSETGDQSWRDRVEGRHHIRRDVAAERGTRSGDVALSAKTSKRGLGKNTPRGFDREDDDTEAKNDGAVAPEGWRQRRGGGFHPAVD